MTTAPKMMERTATESEAKPLLKSVPGVPEKSKINLDFPERYQPILVAAVKRFPNITVWGSHIHEGHGYGIFFNDKISTSCFQVRSLVLEDGVPKANDLMTLEPDELSELLTKTFDVIETSLNQRRLAAEGANGAKK